MSRICLIIAALVAVAAVIFCVASAVEYILVTGYWYQLKHRFLFWDNLYFAFRSGGPESTSRLAIVFGAAGALSWTSLSVGNYTRGVGIAFASAFAICYFFIRQDIFLDVLTLVMIQVSVLVTFVGFNRWAWRIGLRGLFALVTLAVFLLAFQRSIIVLDQTRTNGPIDIFLPLLGLSAGVTTIAFTSKSNVSPDRRKAYLVAVSFGAFAYGYFVACMFEKVPAMQWGRGQLSSFPFIGRNFHYAYAVLFPLAGLVTATTAPMLNGLIDAMRRLFSRAHSEP